MWILKVFQCLKTMESKIQMSLKQTNTQNHVAVAIVIN